MFILPPKHSWKCQLTIQCFDVRRSGLRGEQAVGQSFQIPSSHVQNVFQIRMLKCIDQFKILK